MIESGGIFVNNSCVEARRGVWAQACEWVRFPLEKNKCFIFSLVRSGVEAKGEYGGSGEGVSYS